MGRLYEQQPGTKESQRDAQGNGGSVYRHRLGTKESQRGARGNGGTVYRQRPGTKDSQRDAQGNGGTVDRARWSTSGTQKAMGGLEIDRVRGLMIHRRRRGTKGGLCVWLMGTKKSQRQATRKDGTVQ